MSLPVYEGLKTWDLGKLVQIRRISFYGNIIQIANGKSLIFLFSFFFVRKFCHTMLRSNIDYRKLSNLVGVGVYNRLFSFDLKEGLLKNLSPC